MPFFCAVPLTVEKRYATLTFFLEDALQLAIQIYVVQWQSLFHCFVQGHIHLQKLDASNAMLAL